MLLFFRAMGTNPYKRMAERFGAPYEPGITRMGVLNRDGWVCKMEVCLYEDRAIDRTVRRIGNGQIPDEGGSVDHIVPLSVPGTPGHVGSNVRAAHRLCNRTGLYLPGLPLEAVLALSSDCLKELKRRGVDPPRERRPP